MPYKNFGGHRWKWVCSRTTEAKAENVKRRLLDKAPIYTESHGYVLYGNTVHVMIHKKKLGSKTALVPTVYEVYARPAMIHADGYGISGRKFATLCRIATYGD